MSNFELNIQCKYHYIPNFLQFRSRLADLSNETHYFKLLPRTEDSGETPPNIPFVLEINKDDSTEQVEKKFHDWINRCVENWEEVDSDFDHQLYESFISEITEEGDEEEVRERYQEADYMDDAYIKDYYICEVDFQSKEAQKFTVEGTRTIVLNYFAVDAKEDRLFQ